MLALLVVFRGYYNSFNLYNVAELCWNRIGRSGVQAETENEKFAAMCSRSLQNLKSFHDIVLPRTAKKCIKIYNARVGHSFAHYKILLFYDVPVAVAVVSA